MTDQEAGKPEDREVDLGSVRKIRALADRMTITVNELTIAAGVIKIVRHAKKDDREPEVIFDELNDDEFSMKYAG